MNAAQKVMRRINVLAAISDEPQKITRLFASPAMKRANELVGGWMHEAGMTTCMDAMGNLIGRYDGADASAKILLLGSHLDTVRNAGKFDGPLGVLLAVACVEHLHKKTARLPFAIEVVAFGDEEGVRYQTAYLGSKALAGCFDESDFARVDTDGISMHDALEDFGGEPAEVASARLDPATLLGYLEAHIEQGPVLEGKNLPVGVVSAIAGQTRCNISFVGCAGHAGTTPMNLRKDALCAAAEFVLAVEQMANKTSGLVATVGQIHVERGASNVIPGATNLTLDVRHQVDKTRRTACTALQKEARRIAGARKLKVTWRLVQQTAAVPCAPEFSTLLGQAVGKFTRQTITLPSGAGHDAAVMSRITPVAMLFIRCKGGISHHPDESTDQADVAVALDVMNDFIQQLAQMP